MSELDNTVEEIVEETASEITSSIEPKWTNVQIDSTLLSIFMSCPQKYEYVHERQLVPIEGLSKSIIRGLIVHDALLAYWKERLNNDMDYQTAIQTSIRNAQSALGENLKFEQEERLDILSNLLEYLKYIQSSSFIPIAAEKFFRVKIYENPSTMIRIFITGRIDLIVKTPQIPVLPIDVKTESERWFHTQQSNQFRIYCLACGVNLIGIQRVGFQKSLEVKDRFKLDMMGIDVDVLEEFRTVTLPHYVNQLLLANHTRYFPMNTTNCVHGHFKCQFSDAYNGGICNVSRNLREQKLERYFVVGEGWNPEN